jgi:hypothetical protein
MTDTRVEKLQAFTKRIRAVDAEGEPFAALRDIDADMEAVRLGFLDDDDEEPTREYVLARCALLIAFGEKILEIEGKQRRAER